MYGGKKGELAVVGILALVLTAGFWGWFGLDGNPFLSSNALTGAVIGTENLDVEKLRIQATYGGDGATDCGTNVVENSTLVGNIGPCDITNGLILGASDITLDCNGFRIFGSETAGDAAIAITGSDRTTIRDCVFLNFTDGVDLSSDTDNTTIMNNTFLQNRSGASMLGVDISGGSDYTWIVNNTFRHISGAIQIQSSYNTSIQDNVIANATNYGVRVASIARSNTTIHNNTFFRSGGGAGVVVTGSSWVKVIGNNFTNQTNAVTADTRVNELLIEGGSMSGGGSEEISFNNVQNSTIRGVMVRDSGTGGIIITTSSYNITIERVTVIDSETTGVLLNGNSGAANVTLRYSNLSRNRFYDLNILGGVTNENYTIYGNQISSNITIDEQVDTNGTRIFNNNIYALRALVRSYNNDSPLESSIWNRTLQNLSQNILGGVAMGGNFYSNYTGVDNNDDGIGDTAYFVPGSGNSSDGYPLVRVYPFIAPDRGTIADTLSVNNTWNYTNPMRPESNHSTAQNITFMNYTSGRKYLTLGLNFTQAGNATHLRIYANETAIAVNLTAVTVRIHNLTLYLNNSNSGRGVIVCPHAQNLSGVGPNCDNRTLFTEQNVSTLPASIGTIRVRLDGDQYTIENMSATGAMLLADGDFPNVSAFGMNFTNGSNFSQSVFITITVKADDRTTLVDTFQYGIFNTANNSEFNLTADPSGSPNEFSRLLNLAGLSDGRFIIRAYVNDTLNNRNSSIANLSFTFDRVAPPVTVWTNYSGVYFGRSFNLSAAKLEVNITANDTTSYTQAVVVTFNTTNGTGFNATATRNASAFVVVIDTALLNEGVTYMIIPIANDSVGNSNNTERNITFTVDRVAPPISAVWMNTSNASNFSGSQVSKLIFNATVNDTTLSVQEVRFGFYQGNTSGFNITALRNQSGVWAGEIDTAFISDGIYTVLISVNDTVDNRNNTVANLTFTIDRVPPNVTQFMLNSSTTLNGSNHTNAGVLRFNVTANDSTTTAETIRVGLTNDFRNGTEFNVTLQRGNDVYTAEVALNTLTDGLYSMKVYANDTINNVNNSVANLSFRVDTTPPNVSQFVLNFTTALNSSNYTNTGVVELNVTINDSTTTVETIRVGLTNDFRNGTEFNVSLARTGPVYRLALALNTLTDGLYSMKVYANDTINNVNNSVANLSFRVDTTSPNVTALGMNATNNTEFAPIGGVLQFNVTVNDSTTTVQAVTFGFTNSENSSEFNVTATRNETGGIYSATVPIVPLTVGRYTVKVYATDTLGNINTSVASVTFRLAAAPGVGQGGGGPPPEAEVIAPVIPPVAEVQPAPPSPVAPPSAEVSARPVLESGKYKYGRSCPSEFKQVGEECVPYGELPVTELVFLDDLEDHVKELRPTIYTAKVAELPVVETEKCLANTFLPVQEVTAGLYRQALILSPDEKSKVLHEIQDDRIKILTLFNNVKGSACVEINVNEKSSNPLLQLSWLAQLTGLFTEEFCLELKGDVVAVPQEFQLCPKLKQLADEQKLEVETSVTLVVKS